MKTHRKLKLVIDDHRKAEIAADLKWHARITARSQPWKGLTRQEAYLKGFEERLLQEEAERQFAWDTRR